MQCIFPKSRTFVILVTFLDDSKRFFKVPIKQKGSATLINITNSISVSNREYFGLKYFDKFQKPHWINLDKSLYQQLKKSQINGTAELSSEHYYHLEFEVRYYPRDPTSIDDENFRYQIFLQIRKDLSTMKLVIKEESILSILCGLILQSDFGDYSGNRFAPHYIRQTISPHLLTPSLEEKIKNEHIKLRGVEPVEAEYRFLEKIRWLENYGTIIFPVKDVHNKYCYFGLNPQGFSLRFHKEPNLNYDIFWPRISAIRRKGRQIVIKEKTDRAKKHYFETGEKALCVVLYKLSLDHFAFFKSKKDEKPRVSEPPKRSFGRSSSKEFGYSSDTSDNNQYSDDTFSSYPDSINTTQSSKVTKGFNKAQVPLRNCVSDAEESALSRKNRKVIVTKSQTETEDEELQSYGNSITKINTFDFGVQQIMIKPSMPHSKSFDRIPPDYIYENRLSKPVDTVNLQSRQKRMRKRVPNKSHAERKNRDHKEIQIETGLSGSMEKKCFDTPVNVGTNEPDIRQMRSRSILDDEATLQKQLPSRFVMPQSLESVNKNSFPIKDYQINQSASVDSISTLKHSDNRVSPNKRMLPNLSVVVSANSTKNPPIPRHRVQPRIPVNQDYQSNCHQIYGDIWYKPGYSNVPSRVSHHSNLNERKSSSKNMISQKNTQNRIYQRPGTNYQSRFRSESGI